MNREFVMRKSLSMRSMMTTAVRVKLLAAVMIVVTVLVCRPVHANGYVEYTALDQAAQSLKYQYATQIMSAGSATMLNDMDGDIDEFGTSHEGRKSPFKAFLLSAAVPGLGQWYYGSRIKPFIFLGVEAAAWGMHIKYHADGEDATDAYEAFSNLHWSRDDYEQKYLLWAYGFADDELIQEREISHRLPDTKTQQYYEMTGKYSQFAWGWDDAVYKDSTLDDYSLSNPPNRITSESYAPSSANRNKYETMRDDANKKFDKATKMIFVSIANRLVSALEAYFVTKHRNDSTHDTEFVQKDQNMLEKLKFKASLKSYNSRRDTPYVKVTYKF